MKQKLSLLSLYSVFLLAGTAISPVISPMAQAMMPEGEEFAKLFFTLPSIIVIPFLFISGLLSVFFSKKNIILLGLFMYIISGLGSLVAFDKNTLLFFRSLSGVGAGLVMPYASAIISEYYHGKERDSILGKSGIVQNGFGVILLISGGMLVDIYWKLGFLVYLIAFLPFILIKNNIKKNNVKQDKKKYPFIAYINFKASIFKFIGIYFVMAGLTFVYFSYLPFLIQQNKLGSSFNTGVAQSFYMFFAIFANIFMPILKRKSIRLLLVIQFTLITICFTTLGFAKEIYYVYLASAFLGLGYGSFGNLITLMVAEKTTKINRINALSMVSGAMFLAQFIFPILAGYIMKLFNMQNYSTIFLLEATLFTVIIGIMYFLLIKRFLKGEHVFRYTKRNH